MTALHLSKTKMAISKGDGWRLLASHDGDSGHRPNRQPPHRKPISGWINPRRHHTYLPIYQVKLARRPFTKLKFVGAGREDSTCGQSRTLAGPRHQASGLRIGSSLEYLLRGMTFDVMKAKGRWMGDSFLLHLRKHAVIIASYIQAVSTVHEAFVDAPSALRHARRPAQSPIEGE